MVFGKSTIEFKVGIFVLIGLVILFMFVMLIGDIKNMISAYKLNIVFSFVNGVKIGAPVRYAGVDIGEVSDMTIIGEGAVSKVVVKALIRRSVRVPRDSQVWINTLGILGEKYVEVMPGKSDQSFQPGETIAGNDPVTMQEFGTIAKSVAMKLDEGLTDFKNLAISMNALTGHLDDALQRIQNGEGSLGKLIYQDDIYNELGALISDVRRNPWKLFWKGKEKK
jgi:phospholipid/cholesterol/gamma-HCH transport system substrate-binding protein